MSQEKKKKENDAQARPPVVVVLGHVDHGKSSLLEAIKDLKITGGESGGITQHIGAYMISHEGSDITFIDTPGHEAFFEMRSRGAKVADIGILVIDAEESIKEQTREAIKHLKEMEIPYVVAMNKMDKKGADPEKVKQDLTKEDILVEAYGGNIPTVEISAKKKEGMDDLLEVINLLAQMEDLKARKDAAAEGMVIEAKKDPQKGMVATFLVREGTLKRGDIIGTEGAHGKVRAMEDFQGEEKESATPSMPVQVIGLKGGPKAGKDFFVFDSTSDAKKFSKEGGEKRGGSAKPSEDKKSLNVVIKADVVGSLEATLDSISKIPQSKIDINPVVSDIGNVSESDIESAKAAEAEVFAFRVNADKAAENMAKKEGIKIRSFDVIYELIDEIKEEAKKRLDPVVVKNETGKAKVLAIFKTQKNRQIIGGKCLKGEITKGSPLELWRDEEKVGRGKVVNVKKEEKDMERIPEGEEFGTLVETNEKINEGDVIVLYKEEEKEEELE